MRKEEEKKTTFEFVSTHPLATLATIGADASPQLSAVYAIIGPGLTSTFVTKTATRKYENLQRDPRATLLFTNEEALTSVEMVGAVTVLNDTLDVAKGIERFQDMATARKNFYWVPPIAQIKAGNYVVCRFTPSTVHYCTFARSVRDGSRPHTFSF